MLKNCSKRKEKGASNWADTTSCLETPSQSPCLIQWEGPGGRLKAYLSLLVGKRAETGDRGQSAGLARRLPRLGPQHRSLNTSFFSVRVTGFKAHQPHVFDMATFGVGLVVVRTEQASSMISY